MANATTAGFFRIEEPCSRYPKKDLCTRCTFSAFSYVQLPCDGQVAWRHGEGSNSSSRVMASEIVYTALEYLFLRALTHTQEAATRALYGF